MAEVELRHQEIEDFLSAGERLVSRQERLTVSSLLHRF